MSSQALTELRSVEGEARTHGGIRGFAARNRGWLAAAVVLVVLILSFTALHALLKEVRARDVSTALWAIPPVRWGLAVLATAGSFACLTMYDALALRTIGRRLPYALVARTAATSYAIANMLGLTLLTGGSVRLRLYTRAGLSPEDVARVITLAVFTFWAGVFVLAGLMLLVTPDALRFGGIQLPAAAGYAIGGVIAALLLAYLLFAARGSRRLSAFGYSLQLPGAKTALLQVAVAALDLCCSSAVLFLLVPGIGADGYPALVTAYVVALVVAVATHTPGGLGVFEAVLLLALPDVDKTALAAGLIGYRLVYYLLPFAIAAATLLFSEGRALRRHADPYLRGGRAVAVSVAPPVMALCVFAAGAVLIVTGAFPAVPDRLHALAQVLPVLVIDLSHLVASLIGTLLLFVAYGLYRRLDAAYYAAAALLLAGALFALLRGVDFVEASVLVAAWLLLLWTKPAFYRQSSFTRERLSLPWLGAMVVVLLTATYLGAFAYKHVEYDGDLWWQLGRADDASRYLRASFVSALVVAGFAIWRLAAPGDSAPRLDTLPPEVWTAALASAVSSDAHLARTGDKRFLVAPEGDAFLMYQVKGRSWIAMGDPVGPLERWSGLMWALRDRADRHQGRVAFYQISAEALPLVINQGLGLMKLGEEARVPLADFSLEGSARRKLRQATTRLEREGCTFEVVPAAAVPPLLPRLRAVSDAWLADKDQEEKRFSLGRFDDDYVAGQAVALVRRGDDILAFANLWTLPSRTELSFDMMRHLPDAPGGLMDFLFARLMLWGRAEGYAWFNLGMAPLSGIEDRRLAPLWARAAALLYRHGERLYGYEGLKAYKQKFHPIWRGRYLAAPRGLGLAKALIDVTRLVSG